MWLLFAGCTQQEPPEWVVFDPAGVGFGFDGVVLTDGTITDYVLDGYAYAPILFEVFASAGFLEGTAPVEETCVAHGLFAPPPLPAEAPLPTEDGSPLFASWEGTLATDWTTCIGKVPAEEWGDDASGLWGPLDGLRVGFGIGPQVDSLRDTWDQADLDAVGDAMLAGWFAFEDSDGTWAAYPWTTVIAYTLDPVTLDPILVYDEFGAPSLLPEDTTTWDVGEPLPPILLRSTPVVYQDSLPLVTLTETSATDPTSAP